MSGRPEVRYEDAAELRDIRSWVCRTCGHLWGQDEHAARYCHATDSPCECGARIDGKGWTCCEACRRKHADERWAKLERFEWDGETPLATWDDDRFFFSAEEVEDYLEDVEPGEEPRDIQSLRLVLCEPDNGRPFDMLDFLSDHLPDDDGLDGEDCREIEKTVNDWIARHAPLCWRATNQRVSDESLALHFQPRPEVQGCD